ncbi:YfhO family protein [Candidatus Microgenomates bacterium]|nr:YfhO family protein [Candidatus Microgenomates bacterium]
MSVLKRISYKLFKNCWPFFLLVLIVCTFFWKVFLFKQVPVSGDLVVGTYLPWLDYKWGYPAGVPVKNPITSDAISFSYPMRMLAIDLMKSGQWPLWNPYILFGTPLLANFQSAPFSPTNIFYFLFDKLTAWSWQIILQHILAAVFTYLLLRHWRVGKFGSIIGGVIFAFSGFNLIWSEWNAHTLAAAFIPLLFLFTDRWLMLGKWVNGIGISLSLTLQILSGYPQLLIYSLEAVGLLVLFRIKDIKNRFNNLVFLVIFLVLGVGLAALQLLPAQELLNLSQRKGEQIPQEWAFLSWRQIITFLAPDYFGNHATANYWGPKNYTSNLGFVSVTGFILAQIGLLMWHKSKEIKFLLLILAFSSILAFPTFLSVAFWKSGVFGLQAGISFKSLVIFNSSISCLAGFGFDYWWSKKGKSNIKFVFLIPIILLGGFGLYAVFGLNNEFSKVALRNLFIPSMALLFSAIIILVARGKIKLLGAIILSGILIFELFYFGWKFTPFSSRNIIYPPTPVLDFLNQQDKPFRVEGGNVVPANLLIPYKLETAGGYDAVYPLTMAQFIAAVNTNDSTATPQDRYGIFSKLDSPLLNLINVKYFLIKRTKLDDPFVFDKNRFSLVFQDKSVGVLENKNVLPRAFMVYNWEMEKDQNKTLAKMLDKNFPYSEKIVLEENSPVVSGKGKSEVNWQKYSETERILSVKTTKDGYLFLSDSWYPDWKKYVDGKKEEVQKADFNFQAVPIIAGNHEVKLVYEPNSFFNGLKISEFSLLILVLIIIISRIRLR